MTVSGPAREGPTDDILAAPGAGPRAIRGGAIRTAGYGAGLLLTLISAPLLVRHLGVVDFGGYVTVMSLVMIVGLIADAGLTVVAVREYSVRDSEGRRRLMTNVVSLRLLLGIIGALGATAFAVAAGYDEPLIAGTALAGAGLVLILVQQSYTVPLAAELRLGLIAALDLLNKALSVLGILLLVALGAAVTAFLATSIPVGIAVAGATVFAVRRRIALRPSLDPKEWRYLIRQALPVAAASILGALFYRVAIILMSLISTEEQTGYFSASFRVIEAIIPIPSLMTSTAFPILARAAADAEDRLAYALQRLFEIGLILGGWSALFLVLGADPVIQFLGGSEFEPAVPVLRIQGIATAATFLFAVWAAGLWAVRAQRSLLAATIIGITSVAVLTVLLAPREGATGTAIAMTVSETLLAASAGTFLVRTNPMLRISLKIVPKVVAAFGAGVAIWLVDLPQIVGVLLGTLVYFGLLVALRAIPSDLWKALRRRDRALGN